jgi:hypothetical protein
MVDAPARRAADALIEKSVAAPGGIDMRLTLRDGAATVLLAAVLVPYIGYVATGSMPFVQDPEGMASTGIVFGVVAAIIGGWVAIKHVETVLLGGASMALGMVAAVTEHTFDLATRNGILAGFVGTLVLLWGAALLRHSGFSVTGNADRSHHAPA